MYFIQDRLLPHTARELSEKLILTTLPFIAGFIMFEMTTLVKGAGPLDKKRELLYNSLVLCQDSVTSVETCNVSYGRKSHGMQG